MGNQHLSVGMKLYITSSNGKPLECLLSPSFQYKDSLFSYGISIIKIRLSYLYYGNPYIGKTTVYAEMAPRQNWLCLVYIIGFMQHCSNSSALAMALSQWYTLWNQHMVLPHALPCFGYITVHKLCIYPHPSGFLHCYQAILWLPWCQLSQPGWGWVKPIATKP